MRDLIWVLAAMAIAAMLVVLIAGKLAGGRRPRSRGGNGEETAGVRPIPVPKLRRTPQTRQWCRPHTDV